MHYLIAVLQKFIVEPQNVIVEPRMANGRDPSHGYGRVLEGQAYSFPKGT